MHVLNSDTAIQAATNTNQQTIAPRLIRRSDVQKITGLGASSIYQLQRENDFPQSIQLSERRVAWIESEVLDWIQNRINARTASTSK